MDADVDILHGHIVRYLGEIGSGKLTSEESGDVMGLLLAANNLEQIGDIIETNLVTIGRRRIEEGVVVSDTTRSVIERFHQEVSEALATAVLAVREDSQEAALQVKAMKKDMAELAEETARHQVVRLVANEPNRMHTVTREMEIIENLSRIYRLCRKLAKTQWGEVSAPEFSEAAE